MAKTRTVDIDGWLQVENRLIDDWLPRIGPNGVAVYLMICREVSDRDYPSLAYMRSVLHINHTSILNAINSLYSLGLLNDHDMIMIDGTEQNRTAQRNQAAAATTTITVTEQLTTTHQ